MFFSPFKVVLSLALLCASCSFAHAASCQPLDASTPLPQLITKDQCFELQGGNVINQPTTVLGRLFVKAGRSVNLQAPGAIVVSEKGQFTVRGRLTLESQTQINVQQNSTMNNTGELILQTNTMLKTFDQTKIKNLGQIYLQGDSTLELNGQTEMRNSGIMDFAHAAFKLNDKVKFRSNGTMLFHPHSTLDMTAQAYLYNDGTFNLQPQTFSNLKNSAHLFSRNPFVLEGELTLDNQSILETTAGFDLSPNATLIMTAGTQLSNSHNFEIAGRVHLSQGARFLNEGLCKITEQGSLVLIHNAVLINTGTFRDDFKKLHIAAAHNFVNKNIIYGQDPRANKFN